MNINWDSIKYIFQIPLKWYEDIHKRVFNSYGSDFIVVKEGYYGGTEIGIDSDGFAEEVKRAADLSGYVKTVNSIGPDANGNVQVGNVRSVNSTAPDSTGNVNLGQILSGVDGVTEVDFGMLHLNAARSVNGISVDTNYNIDLPNYVLTVNGTAADLSGNVDIEIGEGTVKAVNNIGPDANGNVSLGDIVHSVNGESPDSNGDVDLGDIVHSVNGESPDSNGDVDLGDIVYSVNGESPDSNGDVDLGDIVYSVNGESPDSNGNVSLGDIVNSVDGVSPVDGDVDFGLAPSKWMKTDASGHLDTTDEVPISLSAGNTGYLYSNNGTLTFKDDEFVTLSTGQFIWATKNFGAPQYFQRSDPNDGSTTAINGAVVSIVGNGYETPGVTLAYQSDVGGYIVRDPYGLQLGDTNSIGLAAPDIVLTGDNTVFIQAPITQIVGNACTLSAPANFAKLTKQPTDTNADSLAIATCGYVQNQLSGVTNDNLYIVNAVEWTGTRLKISRYRLTFQNGILKDFTNATPTYIDTVTYNP